MKLALSLNAINLIVASVMSAGVVGVTVTTVIDNNSNLESESSGVTNEAEIIDELAVEKTTGGKPNEQEGQKEREDNNESATTQNSVTTWQNTTTSPATSNSTPATSAPTANNNTPTPASTQTTPAPAERENTNASGLPDTISRYEWERQNGWKQLVKAAYFNAIERGVTEMYSCDNSGCMVQYYQITGVATDICYATVHVDLEVSGETKMEVVSASLISAPNARCDSIRPQIISVPGLSLLTTYLRQFEEEYGYYQKIKGGSAR